MNFGIIRFPESTCHFDTSYILTDILEQNAVEIWYKEAELPKLDAIIIPGGIYKMNLKKALIVPEIIKYVKNGGFALGIGNGFQLFCEMNLLPGYLAKNDSGKFHYKNVFIKPKHTYSALTALLDTNLAYKIPIATRFGKFVCDDETIKKMREKEQVLFQYCSEDGHLSEQANPNGSRANIAAICNAGKNVYGIVPQPERAADDELGNTDGIHLFNSILAYLK